MISEASRALKAVAKAEGWMAVVPEETPELGAVMARAILAMEEGGAVVAGEAETALEAKRTALLCVLPTPARFSPIGAMIMGWSASSWSAECC